MFFNFGGEDMSGIVVFVDNGFLKVVNSHFKNTENKAFQKDIFRICKRIADKEKCDLRHVYFYTAPPYLDDQSGRRDIELRRRYEKFVRVLGKNRKVTIREGRCQRLKVDDQFVYTQKGVDTWLVSDLCLFCKDFPDVEKVVLIASDSDFVPVINRVKGEFEVILYTYFDSVRGSRFSTNNELLNACSRWVKLNGGDFE
jgi:uncharacterized LabA/DUF88 family protein